MKEYHVKYHVDYRPSFDWGRIDLADIPLVGAPGTKCVVISVYYGQPESEKIAFHVDAKQSQDVYDAASYQCSLFAEQKGIDPKEVFYKIQSIEDVE